MDPRHLAHADADPDFYDDVWQVPCDAADVLAVGCSLTAGYKPSHWTGRAACCRRRGRRQP